MKHRHSKTIRRLLPTTVALYLLLTVCAERPCDTDTVLSLHQAQNDLEELRDRILNNHPLNFASGANAEAAFNRQHDLLRDSMTVVEFYRVAAPAVAAVQCGHTRLYLPECLQEEFYLHGNFMPFEIKVVRDSLVIVKSFARGSDIPAGSVLLSINGRQTDEIIEQLKKALHADGNNETYKYFQINESFRRHYFEAIEDTSEFDLECLIPASDDTIRTTVGAMSPAAISELESTGRSGEVDRPTIETSFAPDSSYSILRVGFFYDPDAFAERIGRFFSALENKPVKSLILDLRRNDGGDPYSAAHLLRYLIGEPFRYFASRSTFLYGDLKQIQTPAENAFTGKLYVLVDGGCYSTTGHFLSLLRTHGRGVFIGEETGGSYFCNGGFKEHRLTHSGLELLLPHTTFVADAHGLPGGRGITPDMVVGSSVVDVANGADPILDTALAIIKGGR